MPFRMHQRCRVDTVGAICARDYKGVGNEFVAEGKVIIFERT